MNGMMGIDGMNDRRLDQFIELLDQVLEVLQGRVHGLGAGHVHTGIAQQIERIFGAARLQEAQILVPLPVVSVEDAL